MTNDEPRPPRFSISIPALGQSEFVPTALSSLRAQDVPIELAVLDASTDDRVQEILRAQKTPVTYGYHHADAGQAAAIQEGWNHTTGEIVAWLCADDYYFPGALRVVADAFHAHPDADVIFGHAVHVTADGGFEGYFPSTNADPAALRQGCTICQPACFVRRDAMKRAGGLNTTLHYSMDWDFWLRLQDSGARFRFVDALLAAVRVYPATKTRSGTTRRRKEIGEMLASHGITAPARWRADLAFWRQDLSYAGASAVARHALDAAAKVRRGALGTTRAEIGGLECWTNRVTAGCVVEVPWYASPAREATVVANRSIDGAVSVNGRAATLEPIDVRDLAVDGRTVRGHRYRIAIAPPQDGRLSFHFDRAARPWRLLRLDVR